MIPPPKNEPRPRGMPNQVFLAYFEPRFVASFAGLASAWERLAQSDERAYPRVAAMHSWKQRTR